MRQGLRLIVAVLALVLGLHVFMLAGLGDHDMKMPAGDGVTGMAALGPAGSLAEPTGVGHDMAAACAAVLAGILLLGVGLGGTRSGGRQEQWRWPAAPADPPPSRPPIALGISRT
jgi:hypothetical protein